jgi:hypothetical protein
MTALRPLWREWCRLYYRTALAHLQRRDPLSPDVNALVLTINQLERPL